MRDLFKPAVLKEALLTAISYMIPIVCGAGFVMAIGMALGGTQAQTLAPGSYSLWDAMASLGGAALNMLPMIISTGIAFAVAGKPGIAPGLVTGLAAITVQAGFIGGILGGYVAGWLAAAALRYLKVPAWAQGLIPTLIVPFVACLGAGLVMVYVFGAPVAWFTQALTDFLHSMSGASNTLFGALVGVLGVVDFGGPINKTVFAFSLTLQAEGIDGPVTVLQLANTGVPIGFGCAYLVSKLFRKPIYTAAEVETLKTAVPMGVVNIVEGTLPIIMNDLVRGVIATGCGGAVAGAVIMGVTQGAGASVPFGGFLMLPTMGRFWWAGLLGIIADAATIALVYTLLKKPVPKEAQDTAAYAAQEEQEPQLDPDDLQVM